MLGGTISWKMCFAKPDFGIGGVAANRRQKHGKVIKIMSANIYGILILCQALGRCPGKKTHLGEVEKTSTRGGSYADN